MTGYLLDTNAVCRWHSQHPKFVEHIKALPDSAVVVVSAITLGELECSHNLFIKKRDIAKRDEFVKFVDTQFPEGRVLPVGRHTREHYGMIRAPSPHIFGQVSRSEVHANRLTRWDRS